jgi:hypothetical protein
VRAPEEARRGGWVSHQDERTKMVVWTHPDRPSLKYYGSAINIPEEYR